MEEFEAFRVTVRDQFPRIDDLAVAEINRVRAGISNTFSAELNLSDDFDPNREDYDVDEAFIYVSVVRQFLTLPVLLSHTASERLHELAEKGRVNGIEGYPKLYLSSGEAGKPFHNLSGEEIEKILDLDKSLLFLIHSLRKPPGPLPGSDPGGTPRSPPQSGGPSAFTRKERPKSEFNFDKFLVGEREYLETASLQKPKMK